MGTRWRPLFDLNEPPPEEEEVKFNAQLQPLKSVPSSSSQNSNLFLLEQSFQHRSNSSTFTHASSSSGFQPFIRCQDNDNLRKPSLPSAGDSITNNCIPPVVIDHRNDNDGAKMMSSADLDTYASEKEEGELCDMEDSVDNDQSDRIDANYGKEISQGSLKQSEDRSPARYSMLAETKDKYHDVKANEESDFVSKEDASTDGRESQLVKPKDVKGIEANHALRLATHPAKRPKLNDHKEAMLGKKRARQTVFIPMEDAKQAGPLKNSTAKRQASFSASAITHTTKETSRARSSLVERNMERQKDKQPDSSNLEEKVPKHLINQLDESNGDVSSDPEGVLEDGTQTIPRLNSSKQSIESRHNKHSQGSSWKSNAVVCNADKSGNKKHSSAKKQTSNDMQYQDSSIERLLREVTNDKFWCSEDRELECVPGHFDCVEEYIRVFEPLLFEECRAQLYSTWEELTEATTRDVHTVVRLKTVERRERGWYDAVAAPVQECKWTFKEGDVAVLSSQRPESLQAARSRKSITNAEEDVDRVTGGRVVGTVRRYIPVDTREPPGVILHFYVGDSYGVSKDVNNVLRKLQPKSICFLTVLGSLTTTQREYIALHAFRRLSLQMQTAILKPKPEYFPKYEEQAPAMPECFTQNFVEHLHRTFNGPQLSAIQWAAMHTAAGTSSGVSKRQEPWPFTLVQGPPGTGKTHTVWGMLNVIHLVQYQRYYTALLKKLAPESYKQVSESSSDFTGTGSIDEVLQNMDESLFRTLPKLCPKPRMLVCAPSNAATDELLARVLDRGFIDGEMKLYRPDVARVGVDSQTQAAQAVSVERRTEQLLMKGRDEVVGWLHQLKARESQFAQQISHLQRELNVAAAAGRSQGSVGVDPDFLAARDQGRDILLQNLAAALEGRDKVLVEMSRLLILEQKFRAGSNFNIDDVRGNLEASFANEAEIVFTTVSSSGRKIFSRLSHGFDMVVIDEAAQASEVAVLPPLSLGVARCVLVGDPQQLPATVVSKAAGKLLYSRSLFERFQQAGCPTILLSVQYRMHPQIRDFPSRYFYQGRLSDSESVVNLPDEAFYKDPLMQAYIFYDISHGRESQRGGSVSYQNVQEAQFSLRLYEHLQKILKSIGGKKVSVGIITPYKLQLKCLQREFEEVLNTEDGKEIYINTVDAFQGQERDVIIMSCVRASNHGVGFVADIRRMNVALTRARRALWVVGNANALMQSEDWAALIADAKSRKCFMDIDSIPKELLLPKGSSYMPDRASSTMRNSRSRTQRPR